MLCDEESIALPIQAQKHQQNLQDLCLALPKPKRKKKSGKAYENFKILLYFLLLSKGKVMSFLYTST